MAYKFNSVIAFDQRVVYLLTAYHNRQDAQAIQDALVLSVILFWQGIIKEEGSPARLRATHHKDGYIWTVFQHRDWLLQHGLSERQAEHSLKRLKQAGLIVTETGYSNFHNKGRAVFIRLNEQGIRDAIEQYRSLLQGRYHELQEKQEAKHSPERQREIESLETIYGGVAPALDEMRKESVERESLAKQAVIEWNK